MKIRSLLIGMLASIALVGCTNDDESPLAQEQEQEVATIFSVNLQGKTGSRAISDGTGATQLMYAVFEKVSETKMNQVVLKQVINDTEGDLLGDGYNLKINLLNGRTYQVVFWAQNSEAKDSEGNPYYIVSDDMKVKVNYNGPNNDETRDAFFATETITTGAQSTYNVTLKRPFAQVNVGAYQTDLKEAERLGIKVTQSSATFANVPNVINLLDGNVSGETNVTYSFSNLPSELLKRVDIDNDGYHELYNWVSMSYILASTGWKQQKMHFTFRDEKNPNAVIFFEKTLDVNRNYRTNIVGQVLTDENNFIIKTDELYEDEKGSVDKIVYVFKEETIIKDETFALNNSKHGTWCIFTQPRDANHLISFDNVRFSGRLYSIDFGDYYGPKYNKYSFNINKVTAENIEVANCVSNVNDVFSLLFYLRGKTNVTNCTWTGTTTVENESITDGQINLDPNNVFDCGVPNWCNSTISSSTIGKIYIWSYAQATIKGNSKIGTIRCAANDNDPKAYLTIGSEKIGDSVDNTVVDKIVITPFINNGKLYNTPLNIMEGAEVKELVLNGASVNKINIQPGAKVNGKTFEEGMTVKEFLGVE